MAQYDLLLTQNVNAAGIEFSEKYINIGKGGILTADAAQTPIVVPVGADGCNLVSDSAQAAGFKWEAKPSLVQLHTQNTDTGTNSTVFELDNDGYKIELTAESASKFGVKVDGGATYADLQAKDATFNKVTVSTAPSLGTDLTNKTYVDGLLAANDAMIFKGTIGAAGTITTAAFNALATYNAGWTYRVIDAAQTIRGVVCEIGDLVTVIVDRTGAGNLNSDFTVFQTNIDGAVVGPASATDNYPALFNGASGKLIKAGTAALGSMAYETATNYILKSVLTAADQVMISTGVSTPAPLTVGASTFVGRKASGGVSAMTAAEARVILNIADGATANTKATSAEVNAGTDDAKFITPLAIANSNQVRNNAGSFVADRIATFVDTTGRIIKDSGKVLTDFMENWCAAPGSKTSPGIVGQKAYDGNWFYICTATNTWKRSPIATNW